MTPEEAIKIIEVVQAEIEWNAPLDYQEAFDMALKALENQIQKNPKAPTWVCPVCGSDVEIGWSVE